MPRDYRLYLEDIVEAADRILRYTVGMDYDSFASDDRTQDAVIRNLEIIGEAAKRLPQVRDRGCRISNGVRSRDSETSSFMSILASTR